MIDTVTPTRAHDVALGELDAFLALLRTLSPHEWDLPTDCTRWTVRDVVAHVTGAMEEGARTRVLLRHLALARRRHPDLSQLDAINELQIEDRRGATPQELLAELAALGPRAARARRRMPRPVRNLRLPGDGGLPPASTFAYLVDVIYPRDLWMHRVDVARATGRDLALTATESDVVDQVVRDLTVVWDGPPATLTLTGHGAGTWHLGAGEPRANLEADAVETCRALSGRDAAPAVVRDGDPAAEIALLTARISF